MIKNAVKPHDRTCPKPILERKKMGLAASQARLLTITARKADCEFESMKLSHQKIALSRDMEKISDEFQAAMNQTKLIYDYYGSGTSEMALTYGLLMSPSVYNDYYPKMLTDKSNKIVLSSTYAAAARAAGIPVEGFNGTPSSEIRNKFVEALRDLGVISPATATNIESVSYNNAVGLGATFSATAATQDITFKQLMDMFKSYSKDSQDYGLQTKFEKPNHAGNSDYNQDGLQYVSTYPDSALLSSNAGPCSYPDKPYNFALSCDMAGKGTVLKNRVSSINLYDLLNTDPETNKDKQYTIEAETGEGATFPAGEAAFMQQWLVGSEETPSFLNWMVDQFSNILGGVAENDLALQYAYCQVYDLIYPNESLQNLGAECKNAFDGGYAGQSEDNRGEWTQSQNKYQQDLNVIATKVDHNYSGDSSGVVGEQAIAYIGGTYSACSSGSTSWWDGGGGRKQGIAYNLNNIAQVFLTAFVEYLEGIENSKYSYDVGLKADASLYEPNDNDIFHIKAPTEVTDGTDNLLAGFYDALFNKICTNGWTQNDNIESIEYMQELLKTGAVFISSINNDGNYYQSSYSTDTYIAEVTDTEGIAQAEARYNAAKAKIENKENTIDMKMKNLDTEISSLTTEYDTMKNVISKTIEKSFKRYDA